MLAVQAEESEPSDFEFEEEEARDAAETDEEEEDLSADDESGTSFDLSALHVATYVTQLQERYCHVNLKHVYARSHSFGSWPGPSALLSFLELALHHLLVCQSALHEQCLANVGRCCYLSFAVGSLQSEMNGVVCTADEEDILNALG